MPVSYSIEITRAGRWIEVNLDKGTWNIYPENFNSMLYLSIDANGTNPVLIDDNTHDFTFDQPTSVYLKADNIVSPLKVYYNNYSVKVSKATPAIPQSDSIVLRNVWTPLTLDEGTWNIYTDNSRNIIQVSLDPTGSNPVSISGDKRQFYFEAQTNIYLRIQTVDPDLEVLVYYNNYSVISIEGTGTGPTPGPSTYTFLSPLNESNGTVSLRFRNDLKLDAGNLTLDINNNSDFQALKLQVTNNESNLNNLEISVQNNEANIVTLQNDVSGNKTAIQNLNTELNKTVKLTGDQTIDGIKTFVISPVVPNPTNNTDAANKLYVDTAITNSSLTFQGALNKQGNVVTIGLENDIVLNGSGDKLTLNLNANSDFRNVLLGLDEAKRIATYTDVGRVMPKQNDFVIDGLTGELTLDMTPTGTLKQNFVDLTSQQIVDGEKDFVKEVRANNLTTHENGLGYGSIDVRKADGYYSISRNGTGQAVDILMALGFVDGTTNVRIRNMAGGIVTFNTLARYDQTFAPTDDKDLVHLAYVRQIREELINLIQSLQGYIHFVGVISNTKQECVTNPDLLTQFVQTEESRAPKNGDFVKTSDSFGFIYNGTNWINFGQVSISIATTTTAGIMMFGTNAGELQDLGGGKAKVIGWDTVEQALRDIDTRTTANTNGLQTANQNIATNTQAIADIRALVNQNTTNIGLKANDADVVKLTGDQTVAGLKTFTSGLKVEQGNNPSIELRDTGGNKSVIIQTIDSGENLQFSVGTGTGAVQFNGKLRYPWNAIPTVTADNEIPSLKQINDTFATIANLNLKANDSEVVKLSGDQVIDGNKSLRGVTTLSTTTRMGYGGNTVLITPEDDSAKTLRFRDTSVGTNNKFNLDLENVCGLTGIKDPTSARDAVPRDWANNQYIPKVTTTATNGIQVTSNAQKAFNFDYVWDDNQAQYRNWSGIKLRCKAQSATAFTDMFYLEYRERDDLGIFMTCVGDKLTFGNPTKVKGVSCEDADSDDTATSKGWIQTNYKKSAIIPVGGSLPTQTASDTIYYIEV